MAAAGSGADSASLPVVIMRRGADNGRPAVLERALSEAARPAVGAGRSALPTGLRASRMRRPAASHVARLNSRFRIVRYPPRHPARGCIGTCSGSNPMWTPRSRGAQKCSPEKFLSFPESRAMTIALFPFRNPITEAIGCLGGIAWYLQSHLEWARL